MLPGDTITARPMLERHFDGLPVVHQGRLVGIITQGDLVKLLLTLLEGTR